MSLEEVWIVCDGRYVDGWEIVSVHRSEAEAAEALTQRRLVESWEVKP
jgi:hypothetical protein